MVLTAIIHSDAIRLVDSRNLRKPGSMDMLLHSATVLSKEAKAPHQVIQHSPYPVGQGRTACTCVRSIPEAAAGLSLPPHLEGSCFLSAFSSDKREGGPFLAVGLFYSVFSDFDSQLPPL